MDPNFNTQTQPPLHFLAPDYKLGMDNRLSVYLLPLLLRLRSMLLLMLSPLRLRSTLPLRLSMLVLTELLLLSRRLLLVSSGSWGLRPLTRAKRFRTSVRLTTPLRWPLSVAPGSDEVGMETLGTAGVYGGPMEWFEICWRVFGGTLTVGVMAGESGTEELGEGASTIHMRWERVATSLATVWARVL